MAEEGFIESCDLPVMRQREEEEGGDNGVCTPMEESRKQSRKAAVMLQIESTNLIRAGSFQSRKRSWKMQK